VKLELHLDGEGATRGGDVSGHVFVGEGGAARRLTVEVRFCERSPGFHSVPFSTRVVVHEGELAAGQTFSFRCELPAGAAPGVRGRNGELFWEVEAAADVPGFDVRASRRFDVVAGGR
jgi:hypothetical protein